MQIIQLYSGQNQLTGDFIYRIEMPGRGLSSVNEIDVMNIDLLRLKNMNCLHEVPLLILHHITDPDLLPVLSHRKKNGLPTVYELADNFKGSYQHEPDALKKGPPDYHTVMELLISMCDAVQTTSPALKDRYLKLNRKFFIFPNLIENISPAKFLDVGCLTIGWAGSMRHYEDIKFYAPELIRWIKENPDTKLALMATKDILDLFRDVPKEQLVTQKPGSLNNYMDFLDAIDIGLAPLLPTEFNACRSDVKFLEYVSRGVLPVCSRFGPYLELWKHYGDLLLFDTPAQLIEHLETLRIDKTGRIALLKSATDFVNSSRNFHTYNWRSRIAKYASLFDSSQKIPTIENKIGNSFCSAITYNLLTKATSDTSDNKVLDLKKAISMEPDNYQAQYFYGAALVEMNYFNEAEVYLKNALKQNPASQRCTKMLAQSYLFDGKINQSIKAAKSGLKQQPNSPVLNYTLAVALVACNKKEQAFAVLRSVIQQFPDFVDAQILFCRVAIQLNRLDKVGKAIKKLRELVPESADGALFQAEIAIAEQDFSEAFNCVSKALDLNPYHKYAKNLLSKINAAVEKGSTTQAHSTATSI